jgi:hypothetical protein
MGVFLIPVAADNADITPLQLERHAAEQGFIITDIRPCSPLSQIELAGQLYQATGDPCGYTFWRADIIANDNDLPEDNE